MSYQTKLERIILDIKELKEEVMSHDLSEEAGEELDEAIEKLEAIHISEPIE